MTLADLIREKAKEYDLNALAAEERGESFQASLWSTVAVTLYELACAYAEAEEMEAA